MQLDNKEAFIKWLVETLNPICEAEPDTLASYVVALVKKDRSESELMDLCYRELEVFLLDETKRFVKKLFETLRTKSYLPKTESYEKLREKVKQPMQLMQYKSLPKRDQEKIENSKVLLSHEKRDSRHHTSSARRRSPNHRIRSRGSSHRTFESSHSRNNKSPPIRLGKRGIRNDLEEDDADDVASMASSRKRNRSDSSDHSTVSRTRFWKSRPQSKTPPSNKHNNDSFKQKCPHYAEKGYCKYGDSCSMQHGEDHIVIDNNFASQSFGTMPTYLPNLNKPPPSLPYGSQFPPHPTINPIPPSFKLPPPQPLQYVQNPYQLPLQQPSVQPSLSENFNQYHPEPYIPMPARFNQPPPLFSSTPYLPSEHKQQPPQTPDVADSSSAAYNPENTSISNDVHIHSDMDDDDEMSMSSRQSTKRSASEVGLTVPSPLDKQPKRVVDSKNSSTPGKKKTGSGSYKYVPNTVLELRRVPPEDNTITNINSHFSKFGIIVNLQINFDNDPSAALVAFASAAQASAAHKSKEPFLNNRFIRIFWHNPEKTGNNASKLATSTPSTQDKQALQKMKTHVSIPERHLLTLDNTKKKGASTEAPAEAKTPVVVPPRSALKLQRNVVKEPNRKIDKTSSRFSDLKSKKANLDKLLQYSKLLSTLFDNATDYEERKQLSLKMESNMRSMKCMEEDMKALSSRKHQPIQAPCNYKLNRKNLANKVVEGETATDAANTPVTEESKAAGEHSKNPFKKVNKPAPPTKALLRVDRRPRELLVTGFPADEDKLSVLSHMKNFGEIEKSGYIEQPASLLVTYKGRTGAEKALSLGAKYKEFDLKIIWWDKLINKNNKTNNNNNNNNNNNKDNSGGEKANDDDADVDKENNNKEAHLMANNNANAVNDAKNNFTNKLVYNNSDTNNTDDNSNSKVCKNASIEGTVSLNKDDDSGIKKPTTDKDDKNSNDDKRGDSGGDADDDGRVGDEEEDEDEDGKKTDASWLGSYFEDFHQNLDYEEDEVLDEGLLDEEEDEEDGGRSWRR